MHISENNEGIAAPTLQSCYLKITTLSKTTCAYILSTALKIVEMASSIAREAKRYCDVMQTEVIISKKNTRWCTICGRDVLNLPSFHASKFKNIILHRITVTLLHILHINPRSADWKILATGMKIAEIAFWLGFRAKTKLAKNKTGRNPVCSHHFLKNIGNWLACLLSLHH